MAPRAVTTDSWIDRCRVECRCVKRLAESFEWAERPEHAGMMQATAALADDAGVSIPGLTVKFEHQMRRFGEWASYALMYREQNRVYRVFMVEVAPADRVTHTGTHGVEVRGPHIHLGDSRHGSADDEIVRPIRRAIETSAHNRWLRRFQRHARTLSSSRYTLTTVAGPLFSGSEVQR